MLRKINNPIYYPLLASVDINGGDTSQEEFREIWDRFDALSEDRKNILTSPEMPEKIRQLQETLSFGDDVIEGVSVLVRWVFFGQLDQRGFQESLKDILSDPDQARAVADFIQKEILTIKPQARAEETEETREEKPKAVTVNMPLLQAMGKYEMLGQQIITTEKIKIKTSTEPVRPSLVYWIKYYRDELGVGYHDSVQRGNFLFRSENGRRLSPEERERINLILRSLEENYPLPIDTKKNEIVFPDFAMLTRTAPQSGAGGPKSVHASPSPSSERRGGENMRSETWTPVVPPAVAKVLERNDRPMPAKGNLGTADFHEEKPKEERQDSYQGGSMGISHEYAGGLRQPSQEAPAAAGRGSARPNVPRQSEGHVGQAPGTGVPARNDSRSDSGRVSFSVNHVFPAEKESQSVPRPKPPLPKAPAPKPNPFHINPVSRDE